MTRDEAERKARKAYELGIAHGRKEIQDELREILGINELIDNMLDQHCSCEHSDEL